MERLLLEQGSQEWHDLRAKYHRTASRTPIVLGLSPFQKKDNLARELKFGIKPYYNNAMKRGNELEPYVRELANKYFNDIFEPAVGINADFLASLDGINFDADTIIEIKVSEHTYNEVKNGRIPEHYKAQMLHQLYVFEAKKAYLVAYSEKNDEIAVSDAVLDDPVWFWNMLTSWKEFENFMSTYELEEEIEHTDTEWEMLACKLKDISDRKKELEAEEAEYKEALLSMANGVKSKGFGVSVYPTKKKSVDYKTLLAENKIDATPYTKESISWSVKVS
ncbi:lambda-exonuclease family protein [Sulfurospirillum sp. UCH001]|uniref:lambda-exonuclease family protein n=1 Tax=Sulfurospirillum sp. UCH001 TaxID=1581011 RepID=UPI0008370CB7|nr:YqaJ viral recombinase family protein [Sulfurospirillum sp. UCH001]